MELTTKTDAKIETWIRNHAAARKSSAPRYRKLLEERVPGPHLTHKLNSYPSLDCLRKAGIQQTCKVYGALAAKRVKMAQWWSDYLDELNKSCLELDTATGEGL